LARLRASPESDVVARQQVSARFPREEQPDATVRTLARLRASPESDVVVRQQASARFPREEQADVTVVRWCLCERVWPPVAPPRFSHVTERAVPLSGWLPYSHSCE